MGNANPQVIGVGNILFHDEGVGVYAARYLQAAYRFTPATEVADGAVMGFGLMGYFQLSGPQARLLILDALAADDQPGTIYRLSGHQLLDLDPAIGPTAHEVAPIQMLKLATALGRRPEMVLLGVVPADTAELAVGLTPQLRKAFPGFVDAALAELRAWGVQAERIHDVSLDDVIGGLVTCQQ